ncbi:two-component system sensor histidine kinase NtrB [Bacillus litorisediminis]|uniref:two-component system sensor histidine kinase NtrB n=1 Tax=Bacillus litorisediminis TaxID=2922713 RepID=UPI001FABE232|nr:ATP-binding protein [Bacillus litorisediminis]
MIVEEQELDFQQLLDFSLDAIFVIKENEIIYANKSALDLLGGNSQQEILNEKFQKYLHPDYYFVCKERLKKVRERLHIAELLEQRIIRKDGEIIDVEVMATPYKFKGEILAQVIIRDITLRKKAEKRLYDAEKLSAIGEIAAGVAHEIKNPLTAITGFLQLLKSEIEHPYLDIISNELDNALSTLTNLLQVAKPDLDNEPSITFNLCLELERLLFLFQDQFYRVEIEKRLSDKEQKIMGKKNLLLKAFFNLLKNAFEAIEDKGKIILEHYFKDGFIHIKISDTGVGIPEDKIKKLGTPFFSTKSEGTGMGLTQVFHTIHTHGGTIDIQSEVGKGTDFLIKIPLL